MFLLYTFLLPSKLSLHLYQISNVHILHFFFFIILEATYTPHQDLPHYWGLAQTSGSEIAIAKFNLVALALREVKHFQMDDLY